MSDEPKSLIVLSPVASLGQGPRLSKLAAVLLEQGLKVEHWGWRRTDTEPTSYLGIDTKILQEGGGYANRKLFGLYVKWVVKLIRHLPKNGRGRDFYCVGFLSAFSVCVTRRILRTTYLYDNNDNFSLSYPWPRPARALLQKLDVYVAKHSKIHLVPSKYRWPKNDGNLRVLANTPSSAAVKEARKIVQDRGIARGDKLTIYVNGRLDRGRGVAELLAAIKLLPPNTVELLVAGELITPEAGELSKLACARYLGVLSNEEALAQYWAAHLAFTFYDPSVPINRLAEPNKWGDCIVANTPFLTNSEVQTAAPYVEANACFTVPYSDTQGLAALLGSLANQPDLLEKARASLTKFKAPPWDEGMRTILQEFVAPSPEK